MKRLPLLPCPRFVARYAGYFLLPSRAALHLAPDLPREGVMLPVAEQLRGAAANAGIELELITGPASHPRLAIRAYRSSAAPSQPEGYQLDIKSSGVAIHYRDEGGLRAAFATLRQLLAEYGRRLPRLKIRDYPDFPRRGVMLDISRGKVPTLQTLKGLANRLADFKVNELQLYTEHTFAYRNYEPVWRDWGALNGQEILELDAHCRGLGIDLVPNQNSFGHLRYWLEHPPLKNLAEVQEPYESADGSFLRRPTTLAPGHPGTLPFLRELFDELLPHFTSRFFNVGCDETWDLGRGQSRAICDKRGKERVYLDFLLRIYEETARRNRKMMFWGDIILNHPDLIRELPKEVIALNWGYEAGHPFERESGLFSQSGIPFYVCPGTSTWMSLIGRNDNAFANLRAGAQAGKKNGAIGYLNTDWGDGGHPQPLAVSYPLFLAGAALSWCGESFDESLLAPVLSRDVFHDPTGRTAKAALGLGVAHRHFGYFSPNVTPFGAVIAAPPPPWRELFCRDGLKYYARIPAKQIHNARDQVEKHRSILRGSKPATVEGEILALELDFAARMAAQSCDIMLWQQRIAAGDRLAARRLARKGIRELQSIDKEFRHYWPIRNKGTTKTCSPFLRWRIEDYRRGRLHYPPEVARVAQKKAYAAE
ncbi:MAG TPA: glycoside hydrolase family 20 zincin-like fold domain-containing protein [Verrucomicrobiae bacterium]|nr:glycoside hydrolase family 20 zincin-like fold domain-containing protein [Verrucomicrobiae bacterium]